MPLGNCCRCRQKKIGVTVAWAIPSVADVTFLLLFGTFLVLTSKVYNIFPKFKKHSEVDIVYDTLIMRQIKILRHKKMTACQTFVADVTQMGHLET